MTFEVIKIDLDLTGGRAHVSLKDRSGGIRGVMVGIRNLPANPPGNQTESELQAQALAQAKAALIAAAAAL